MPISRLADCIIASPQDVEANGLVAPIVGHVGDGNFHLPSCSTPTTRTSSRRAEAVADRLVERALAMGGTCTGEHGIGSGKIAYLEQEHGEAVDLMRTIKAPSTRRHPQPRQDLPPRP